MYQVWKVFEDEGLRIRFYVVNVDKHSTHSEWKNYLEAIAVCDKLNLWANKAQAEA